MYGPPTELFHLSLGSLSVSAHASSRHRSTIAAKISSFELLDLDDDATFPVVLRSPLTLAASSAASSSGGGGGAGGSSASGGAASGGGGMMTGISPGVPPTAVAGTSLVLRQHRLAQGPFLSFYVEAAADLLALPSSGNRSINGGNQGSATAAGGSNQGGSAAGAGTPLLSTSADYYGSASTTTSTTTTTTTTSMIGGGVHGSVLRRVSVGVAPLRASISLAFLYKLVQTFVRSQRVIDQQVLLLKQRATGLSSDVDFPLDLLLLNSSSSSSSSSSAGPTPETIRALRSSVVNTIMGSELVKVLQRRQQQQQQQQTTALVSHAASSSSSPLAFRTSLALAPPAAATTTTAVSNNYYSATQEAIVGLLRARRIGKGDTAVFVQRGFVDTFVAVIDIARGSNEQLQRTGGGGAATLAELKLPPALEKVELFLKWASISGAELAIALPPPRHFTTASQYLSRVEVEALEQAQRLVFRLMGSVSGLRTVKNMASGAGDAIKGMATGDITRAAGGVGTAVGSVIGGVASLTHLAAGTESRGDKRKATSFFDGIAKAGSAIVDGFSQGVNRMAEGMQSGDAKQAISGIGGGMVDILRTSVAGSVSRVLEGVSAGISAPTLAGSRDDSFRYVKRPLYGLAAVLRFYDERDARFFNLLRLLDSGKYRYQSRYGFISAEELKRGGTVILTTSALVCTSASAFTAPLAVHAPAAYLNDPSAKTRYSSSLEVPLREMNLDATFTTGAALTISMRVGNRTGTLVTMPEITVVFRDEHSAERFRRDLFRAAAMAVSF